MTDCPAGFPSEYCEAVSLIQAEAAELGLRVATWKWDHDGQVQLGAMDLDSGEVWFVEAATMGEALPELLALIRGRPGSP